MDLKELVTKKLTEKFPQINFDITDYKDQLAVTFDKEHIVTVSDFLKNEEELQFKLCEDVTAVDWANLPAGRQGRKKRFTFVYHIFSLKLNLRLRLKADIDESDPPVGEASYNIESVSSIWKTANWHE